MFYIRTAVGNEEFENDEIGSYFVFSDGDLEVTLADGAILTYAAGFWQKITEEKSE